jgi:hypothetical protein
VWIAFLKGWNIAALAVLDYQRVIPTFGLVVLAKLGAQPSRLDAHNRVGARVVSLRSIEDLKTEKILFDLIASSPERLLDCEP